MKNILFNKNNNFIIVFGIIKKIKKLGKICFIDILINNKIISIFLKNNKIKFKKSIIGIYYYEKNNDFYLLEICFFNKKYNIIKQKTINFKSCLFFFIRNFFFFLKFKEIETPIIEDFENTGSKQFLVLNKKNQKEFFSLSQSPQKIKQYYMFNIVEKYFQIVKCLRDEDERSSRLKEFHQLDVEISFITFKNLKKIINNLLKKVCFYFINKKVFFLKLKFNFIKKFSFEKKNFKKPYLYKKIKLKKNSFFIFKLHIFKNIFKHKIFYFRIKCYYLILSKNLIKNYLFYTIEFFLNYFNIINLKIIIIWYINFKYFKKNKINHHHFSSYKNNFKNLKKSKSLSYDIYLDGIEIGGGSIRNLNFKIQKKNFFFLKNKKSLFLNFYKKNIPQHCGIALGIERILYILWKCKIYNTTSYFHYTKIINSKKIDDFK